LISACWLLYGSRTLPLLRLQKPMRARDQADTIQLSKIRMKEVLRAKIESEARARGKTMNAVIVDRLERSLAEEADEATYGSQGNAILWLIGRQLRAAASIRAIPVESDWLNDAPAFDLAVRMVNRLFEELRPEGDVPGKEDLDRADSYVHRFLMALADETPNEVWSDWARRTREALGPIAAARIIRRRRARLDPDLV